MSGGRETRCPDGPGKSKAVKQVLHTGLAAIDRNFHTSATISTTKPSLLQGRPTHTNNGTSRKDELSTHVAKLEGQLAAKTQLLASFARSYLEFATESDDETRVEDTIALITKSQILEPETIELATRMCGPTHTLISRFQLASGIFRMGVAWPRIYNNTLHIKHEIIRNCI